MTFIGNLKKPKDMTDDELVEEFEIIQKIAKQRGEHLPLPATAREQVGNGQTPPIHRGETEKQLQALRADFDKDPDMRETLEKRIPTSSKKGEEQQVAQNTVTGVAKGVNKARGIHSLADTVKAGFGLAKHQREKLFNEIKKAGFQGEGSEESIRRRYGHIPGAVEAYIKARKKAKLTPGERAKKQKESQQKKK